MGFFFKETGPQYDINKAKRKLPNGDVSNSEKKQLKKMNKRERETFVMAHVRAKSSQIIDKSGRILVQRAFQEVPEFKRRLANGKCPSCGRSTEKRNHVCDSCKNDVAGWVSAHEINNSLYTPEGNPNIPAGQNTNGIVYDRNGKRVWM